VGQLPAQRQLQRVPGQLVPERPAAERRVAQAERRLQRVPGQLVPERPAAERRVAQAERRLGAAGR
jgi:hypothetical protein